MESKEIDNTQLASQLSNQLVSTLSSFVDCQKNIIQDAMTKDESTGKIKGFESEYFKNMLDLCKTFESFMKKEDETDDKEVDAYDDIKQSIEHLEEKVTIMNETLEILSARIDDLSSDINTKLNAIHDKITE